MRNERKTFWKDTEKASTLGVEEELFSNLSLTQANEKSLTGYGWLEVIFYGLYFLITGSICIYLLKKNNEAWSMMMLFFLGGVLKLGWSKGKLDGFHKGYRAGFQDGDIYGDDFERIRNESVDEKLGRRESS